MSFLDFSILVLYSYVPALVLAAFFWWMDRFTREPWWLVSLAFLWGSVGAIVMSLVWNMRFDALLMGMEGAQSTGDVLGTVLTAPLVEELNKGIFVLVLFYLRRIDSIADGLLLGVIIGLGFAASENVLYAFEIHGASGQLAMWYNLWFREIHTTLLHASATAVWGAMIGYALKFGGFERIFMVINGFVLAVVTHAFWNLMATFISDYGASQRFIENLMRLELVLIFGFLLTLFFVLLKKQSRVIVDELLEESVQGALPLEHVGFFASLVRFPGRHDLPRHLNPRDYARLGVKLAFRKHDYRFRPDPDLMAEIRHLRAELKSCLAK